MHADDANHTAPRQIARRDILRMALGASAVILIEACGPSPSSGGPVPTAGAPAPVNAARPTTQASTVPATAPAQAAAAAQGQPSPAAASQSQAQRGGTLRVGLDVDADTLDPRLTKNTSGF